MGVHDTAVFGVAEPTLRVVAAHCLHQSSFGHSLPMVLWTLSRRSTVFAWSDEDRRVGRLLAMSAQSLREGSGGESVRGLLDEARAAEADDLTRSRALIQQARVLARSTGDLPGEAEALYRLAAITNQLGQLDEAFGLALEARDLAQRGAVVVVEVQALNQLAIVHSQAGNYADALQCSLRALELYRTTDDPAYEGSILNTIASIHHSLRDSDRAIVTYEAALEANRRRGRPDFDAITLANMAKVRAERNENLLAVSLGEAALELARDRLPLYVAEILADLAGAYSSLDMVTQAGRCIADASAALADLAEQGVDVPTSIALAVALAKGKVLIAGGQLEQAIDVLVEAATAAEGRGQSEEALVARQLLADVYKSLRRFEEALNERETCARLHEQIFNRDTDLRIKTLQISHDTQAARDQAELLRVRTTELEQMVAARTHDLEEQHYEAFERLAVIAEYRDADTAQHSTRVGALAAELALQIGEPAAWAKDLCLAGRLHDVGKVAVPDEILRKPGALTPDGVRDHEDPHDGGIVGVLEQ